MDNAPLEFHPERDCGSCFSPGVVISARLEQFRSIIAVKSISAPCARSFNHGGVQATGSSGPERKSPDPVTIGNWRWTMDGRGTARIVGLSMATLYLLVMVLAAATVT